MSKALRDAAAHQAALEAYEKAIDEINGARPLPMEMSA